MAIFHTKIILDKITPQESKKINGKFTLDIEELNIFREFTFSTINNIYSDDCVVLIYKDDKSFLAHTGKISINNLKKYTLEEKVILISFGLIFLAYKGLLNPNQYALTKIIRDSQKILITTAAPDFFRNILTRACL